MSTLLAYQAALVVGGLVIGAVVQVQAWLGYFETRRFVAIQNNALYAISAALNGLVIFFVVYVSAFVF